MFHLKTRSAFFPLVEACLQSNQRFNSGILREAGSLPFKEASGISVVSFEESIVCTYTATAYTVHAAVYTVCVDTHDPWTVISSL